MIDKIFKILNISTAKKSRPGHTSLQVFEFEGFFCSKTFVSVIKCIEPEPAGLNPVRLAHKAIPELQIAIFIFIL
jgi:hypothetical protein